MATIKFFLYSKVKGKLAPIYVRLSAGRGSDIIVKTGETINPELWSYKKQSINKKILDKKELQLKDNLIDLGKCIDTEVNNCFGELSKEWLSEVVYKFHNKKSSDAETFMEYIERFIKEAEAGIRKNENLMNLSEGTLTNLRAFKNQLTDYQVKRTQERKRPIKVDFENVNIDFYTDFVSYLSDQEYAQNTIGKHIKTLKMFMSKSLEEKLHDNRDFQFRSFKGISKKSFNIYLNNSELDLIYNKDLSDNPEYDKARDAFIVLCETGLRISDYTKVDVSIRKSEDGINLIHLSQTKTDGEVVIPVSARLQKILDKYKGTLPRVREQYINRDIKKVAELCKINEVLRWNEKKLGKTYEKTCMKWKKISCQTGRRTFCTNAYLSGIPTISIMMISGHSTEANFLKYIKMSKEENARTLADHEYFKRDILKVI
jgi:integrase